MYYEEICEKGLWVAIVLLTTLSTVGRQTNNAICIATFWGCYSLPIVIDNSARSPKSVQPNDFSRGESATCSGLPVCEGSPPEASS
jgi:hypothetical protein